jgi:dTMP kinase
LAAHIYRLYHNPTRFGVKHISHASLQTLITAAHIEVIESKVIPSLRRGRNVILDRFWWSTWVYGSETGVSRNVLKQLLALEQIAWREIAPTIVFLITRASAVDETVRKSKGKGQLAARYKALARREAALGKYPVSVVGNDRTITDAMRSLRSCLKRRGAL